MMNRRTLLKSTAALSAVAATMPLALTAPAQASLPASAYIRGPMRFPGSKLFLPEGRWKIPNFGKVFPIGNGEEPDWFLGERGPDGWAEPDPAFRADDDNVKHWTVFDYVGDDVEDSTEIHIHGSEWPFDKEGKHTPVEMPNYSMLKFSGRLNPSEPHSPSK